MNRKNIRIEGVMSKFLDSKYSLNCFLLNPDNVNKFLVFDYFTAKNINDFNLRLVGQFEFDI